MTKDSMIKYLQAELLELKTKKEAIETKYRNAKHMERISLAQSLSKAEDLYYHFWMICNDLGITD